MSERQEPINLGRFFVIENRMQAVGITERGKPFTYEHTATLQAPQGPSLTLQVPHVAEFPCGALFEVHLVRVNGGDR